MMFGKTVYCLLYRRYYDRLYDKSAFYPVGICLDFQSLSEMGEKFTEENQAYYCRNNCNRIRNDGGIFSHAV